MARTKRRSLDFWAWDVCFGSVVSTPAGFCKIWMAKESQCQFSRMEDLHSLGGSQIPAEQVHSGLGIPEHLGREAWPGGENPWKKRRGLQNIWTRLARRQCLPVCVPRSLSHMHEPCVASIPKNSAIPDIIPGTWETLQIPTSWYRRIVGTNRNQGENSRNNSPA